MLARTDGARTTFGRVSTVLGNTSQFQLLIGKGVLRLGWNELFPAIRAFDVLPIHTLVVLWLDSRSALWA